MSAYENVIGGKLKLKGKALDVKGGVKKKKKQKRQYDEAPAINEEDKLAGGSEYSSLAEDDEDNNESEHLTREGKAPNFADHLTPAEKRYIEQREQLDKQRHSKTSKKSHRDRLNDFNQYLANLSEHYDIPKVGPG